MKMLLKLFGVLLSTVSLFANVVVTNSTFLIPLTNANATQSETWQAHNASLAIDNDVTTWSVAASQATPGAIGRWKVDLGQTYDVSDVAITSSLDFYNSMYLQTFAINVTTEAGLDTLCYLYNSTISIPVGSTFLLTCSQGPVTGRYVEVWRLPGSTFRQDGLAIAEINIYASNIRSGGVSNYEAEKLVYGADLSYEVSLANHPAYQSRTWGLEGPEKAIDNNVTTFSVACITCNETLTSEPGWWMVDLLNETAVAGVVILASSDPYNARYLNDFDVFLTSTNSSDPKDGRMCASYQNSSTTSPASIIVLVCINQPTRGRYLVVRRQPTASFRPDAIAIAEIRVFTKFSDNQAVVGLNTTDGTATNVNPNSENQATTSRVIQSGTWQNLRAELAVDGNSSTWSTTDTSIDPTWAGQLAWWQMDLGAVRNVTEVTITSSTDYTNSRYLKDFSIDLLMNSRMNSTWISGATQCYYFRGDVEMGATVTYKCYNPTPGRYLLIRRVDTNAYRPDALSLAEVQYKYV